MCICCGHFFSPVLSPAVYLRLTCPVLYIQLQLYFLFCLSLKIRHFYRIHSRQLFQTLNTKCAKKFFCSAEKDRPSRCIKTSKLLYQIILNQLIYSII